MFSKKNKNKPNKDIDDITFGAVMFQMTDDFFEKYCFEVTKDTFLDGKRIMLVWKGDVGGRTMIAMLSTQLDSFLIGLGEGQAFVTDNPKMNFGKMLGDFLDKVLMEWRKNHYGTAKPVEGEVLNDEPAIS